MRRREFEVLYQDGGSFDTFMILPNSRKVCQKQDSSRVATYAVKDSERTNALI